MSSWASPPWRRWIERPLPAAILVFALSLGVFVPLFQGLPVLYDTDSYYHLAIARAYARHGIVDSLPWAQLSLLHDFGDKELLFHVGLVPFADRDDPTAGGRLALALLNALVASALAGLGVRALGVWGFSLPFLAYLGSLPFLGRMIRLRPELLALLLLLAAVALMAEPSRPRNQRLLGLVAFAFTLGYTAFHAFLGVCGLWFLHRAVFRRRIDWGLILYPVVGCGLALVLHPHFPQNLVVWKVQSLDFFTEKAQLDVGREIGPQTTAALLLENAGWWLAVVGLALAGRRRGVAGTSSTGGLATETQAGAMADALWVLTGVFGVLHLLMQRFVLYSVPFALLALAFELRRRGVSPRWVRFPGGRRLPLLLVLLVALGLGTPSAVRQMTGLANADGPVSREDEWLAFGRSLPPGARVAAEWGSTHLYMFFAPQAMFLNVLDPVFMWTPYPEAHRLSREVFEGRAPDVPTALRQGLRSDYLALSRYHRSADLLARLAADPRLEPVHRGYTLLYRLRDDVNQDFVLDWRVGPPGVDQPPPLDQLSDLPSHPRAADALRSLEGYVDTRSDAGVDDGCRLLVHPFEVSTPELRLYELAPYGPTRLWLDDRLVVSTGGTPGAVLGLGLAIPLALTPGHHRLTVSTCPGASASYAGFYLLRRG